MANSTAPAGHAKWSRRLLADKLGELGAVQSISQTQVANALKKRTSTALEKDVVHCPSQRPLYCPRCAHILWLYALPFDGRFPVICFDERPCLLIGEVVDPLALQKAKVCKEHAA